MSDRICGRCGGEAAGFASVWTAKTGDVPYCRGDEDTEPTCYERAQRTVLADASVPLSIGVDWPPTLATAPVSESVAGGEQGVAG